MLDAARAAKKLPGTSLDPDGPIAFWGYSQGGGAAASAAELAPSYAPELKVVGTYAGAPPADLKELFPYADGSVLVGAVGYALNSVITAYPEHADAIRSKLTPRGEDMLFKVADQCIAETIAKFMFRHLQPYFNEDINELVNEEPFSSLFDEQTDRPLQTQCARDDPEQSLRSAGAVDGRQPARPRLVCTRCRRCSSGPTKSRRSSTRRSSTTPADARRRRAGHAVDRRPLQRITEHAELWRVLAPVHTSHIRHRDGATQLRWATRSSLSRRRCDA